MLFSQVRWHLHLEICKFYTQLLNSPVEMTDAVFELSRGKWSFSRFLPHEIFKKLTGMTIGQEKIFLAHQTRFSAILISADKSYLTYPYPTCGIDKKSNTTTCCQYIGCIEGHVTLSLRHWELTSLLCHIRRQLSTCRNVTRWWRHLH